MAAEIEAAMNRRSCRLNQRASEPGDYGIFWIFLVARYLTPTGGRNGHFADRQWKGLKRRLVEAFNRLLARTETGLAHPTALSRLPRN